MKQQFSIFIAGSVLLSVPVVFFATSDVFMSVCGVVYLCGVFVAYRANKRAFHAFYKSCMYVADSILR